MRLCTNVYKILNKLDVKNVKKSTSELAEKIETLITDENLREKFHYNSIEFSKEYSIEKIMKKWNHLFKITF